MQDNCTTAAQGFKNCFLKIEWKWKELQDRALCTTAGKLRTM